VPTEEAQRWFEHWLPSASCGYTGLGIRPEPPSPARHTTRTSSRTTPRARATSNTSFRSAGQSWRESPNRGDFDLTRHAEFSGEKLEYFDQGTGQRYVPHVIEPAAGADRATLAFLVDAYARNVVTEEGAGEGEQRTLLRLHPRLAPVKAAVLPLVKKDGQPELAQEVHRALHSRVQSEYDEGGSIGKRYRRQDEIGTPFCLTIDHQSVEDGTVTLRDRGLAGAGAGGDRGNRGGDRSGA